MTRIRPKDATATIQVTRTQPWHWEFPLDWAHTDPEALTRCVFVASRRGLDLDVLTTEIPDIQVRH